MTRKILVRKFVAIPPAMNAEVPFELPDDAEHVTVSPYNDGLVVLQYVLDAPEEEEEEEEEVVDDIVYVDADETIEEAVAKAKGNSHKKRVKQLA